MGYVKKSNKHWCSTPHTVYGAPTHGDIWQCDCGKQWKWRAIGRRQGCLSIGYWKKVWFKWNR